MEWNGIMESWNHGMEWNGMESWNHGIMEWNGMEWNHGIMESWNHGIMESWNKKVLVHTHTRAQFLPDIYSSHANGILSWSSHIAMKSNSSSVVKPAMISSSKNLRVICSGSHTKGVSVSSSPQLAAW